MTADSRAVPGTSVGHGQATPGLWEPESAGGPNAGPEPVIVVENLVKRYRKASANAVDGISFRVGPGQLFALLGPNGAGKTTTISILTTTLSPSSGGVCIGGYDVERQASAVRQAVGIIFQQPSLDLNLTAEENVRFHAILYGLYPFRLSFRTMPRDYREQVEELAEVMDMAGELGKPVKTFSGGMKRKLEIIRSLIHRPEVLFLDEPTIGLDPLSRRNLWDYLRKVRAERGTTTFLTTHYLEEAEQADAICILNKGRIVAQGTPAEVQADLVQASLLIDAEDREALREELRRKGLAFAEPPPFRVMAGGDRVHALLRSIETPLSLVQTRSPTLEDAYLAIIGQDRASGQDAAELAEPAGAGA
ncbi:MAG: ABC transporter ATP-binding protein [Chloroflexota bacterium]